MLRVITYYSNDKNFAKFERRPTMKIFTALYVQAHKEPFASKVRTAQSLARFLAIGAQSRYSSRFAKFQTFRLDRIAERCVIPGVRVFSSPAPHPCPFRRATRLATISSSISVFRFKAECKIAVVPFLFLLSSFFVPSHFCVFTQFYIHADQRATYRTRC